MPRPTYYSPAIDRFLISVLHHEARHRKIPMTKLTNDILRNGLAQSPGWQSALESMQPEPADLADRRVHFTNKHKHQDRQIV